LKVCERFAAFAKENARARGGLVKKEIERILVTGAIGQVGSELTLALRARYGNDNVLATDLIRDIDNHHELYDSGPFFVLDVTEREDVEAAIMTHRIDTIVHLAALLSATGESDPDFAWEVNVSGMLNVLNTARDHRLTQVFVPSSIAVFGPGTPLENTPNDTVLRPTTIYGVSKVTGELLGNYYVRKWGLDVRGLRYPGIISAGKMPCGGTTDYAVEMFYEAVARKRYTCFVREDTRLPMMYMPDCINATLALMAAPFENLVHHTDFNISGLEFSAGELAEEIKKHLPDFECTFEPDSRQAIADAWTRSTDDTPAREEWGWAPTFDLDAMTRDMLRRLQSRTSRSATG
jgi:threonine 3-dehydrogenase